MKNQFTSILLVLFLLLIGSTAAQEKAGTVKLSDDSDRLMQEYMVRRAEWLELRKVTNEKAQPAEGSNERRQVFDKIKRDERATFGRMAEVTRAYRAAEKAKLAKLGETKRRN